MDVKINIELGECSFLSCSLSFVVCLYFFVFLAERARGRVDNGHDRIVVLPQQ